MKKLVNAGLMLALLILSLFGSLHAQEILFDNGPVVNSPGTGQGGADESIVYDPLTLLAFPNGSPVWTADNFTVTTAGWGIDSISFYDLIPNAPVSPSNFTACYIRVWDGKPGNTGSHVIWGDRTTSRLISSNWSNAYRRGEANPGSTSLAIFRNTCSTPGLALGPGEYWIEAQAAVQDGLYSFGVPVTGTSPATGDAIQFNELTNIWEIIENNSYPQGMPFIVYGENLSVSLDAGILDLVTPQSNSGLGAEEQVTILIKNSGLESLSNIPVYFQLSGGQVFEATIAGPIDPDAEVTFTFPQTIDLSAYGTYKILAGTQLAGDLFELNDSKEFTVRNYGAVVNMQNTSIAACSGLFYDAGGPHGDYADNDTLTMHFHPASDAPNRHLEFTFTEFDLEYPYDKLMIYDGPTWQDSPLIGEYSGGMVNDIGTIRSTDPSGSLTFRFVSDESVSRPGWKAEFHCDIPFDNDLSVTKLKTPPSMTQNTPGSFSVNVRNEGNLPQSNYIIKLFLADQTEIASTEGVLLNYNEEHEFQLLAAIPTSGPVDVYAKVILGNDQDPENDASESTEIIVEPAGTGYIFIGKDNDMDQRLPVSYASLNSLSETIYYPEEIQMEGMINGMGYVYSFRQNVSSVPLTIWMGETWLSDLSAGWIPSSELVQVFDGVVSYAKGVDTVKIDFTTPYEYHGGKLVVLVYRPLDYTSFTGNELGPNLFQVSATEEHPDRSRQFFADIMVIDPARPRFGTTSDMLPNTLLKFDISMMSSLKGKVYGPDNLPLEGAEVTAADCHTVATSHSNGDYALNYIWPGTMMTGATKYLYDDDNALITFSGGSVIHDYHLGLRPEAFITGSVRPSDEPWNGLGGATVTITGYDTSYSTVSQGTGFFLLASVFGNTAYQINVTHPDYEDYNGNFTAGSGTLDLGTIIMNEPTAPPQNIVAVDNSSSAHVSWDAMTLDYTIQYDNDSVYYYLTSFSDNRESAIRFTPGGYPCHLKGAMLNVHDLGAESGNPAGSFKVKVYDDDGTDNLPGTMLGEVMVTPGMDGWVQVDLTSLDISITSGEFYLVHAQVGSWPNYVEIGLDQSYHPENRSYSKPASWSPWALDLYYYHFMIRALVSGPSGQEAMLRPDNSLGQAQESSADGREMTGYSVYRLPAGAEENPSFWTNLSSNQSGTEFDDNAWGSLPWGEYRYAVKTNYSFNVASHPGLSNILSKEMNITATINIITNTDYVPADAVVTLTCTDNDPAHVYRATENINGLLAFSPFYRGTYRVQVSHHNFLPFDQVMDITSQNPVQILLTEKVLQPVFVKAEDQDTLATISWYDPSELRDLVLDDSLADVSFCGMPGYPVWFGNYFQNTCQGDVISVDVFFEQHPFATGEPATIDIFNPQHSLIGTSETFVPVYNQWMTIRVPDVQVSGDFYVMVHFAQTGGDSHYLGFDTNGPNASGESGYAYDGTNWYTMPQFINGLNDGAFLVRPTLNIGTGNAPFSAGRSITNFTVYRLAPGQENFPEQWTFLDNTVTVPSYSDLSWPALDPGNYLYAVSSMYSSGYNSDFAFSNILNHTLILWAPENLSVEQTGDQDALFSWQPVPGNGLISYEVFLDDMDTPVAEVTDTFYTFSGLNADQQYLAGVRAIYGTGESTVSSIPFLLTITGDDPYAINPLLIYPNPASSFITIDGAKGAIAEIYSLNGVKLLSRELDETVSRINLEGIAEGAYILRINLNHTNITRKLIITD